MNLYQLESEYFFFFFQPNQVTGEEDTTELNHAAGSPGRQWWLGMILTHLAH